MWHLGRDIRYAIRGLARSPVFTAVALGSIALGIGANTAIFALVDEVLLRLMPVREPERLILFTGPRNHYGSKETPPRGQRRRADRSLKGTVRDPPALAGAGR